MDLKIRAEQKALGFYVIYLDGSLDSASYHILEQKTEELLKANPKIIAMNMERLSYISSAGIRVILKTRNALKKSDGKLVFMKLQPQIKKVFEIINALPSMKVFSSIEELDDYLDAMQRKITEG
jgi:anti-anti-sigma factor